MLKRSHAQKLATYLSKRVPTASPADTVREIEQRLVHGAGKYSSLDYVYLVDAHNVFKGMLSVREIFRENKDAHLATLKLAELFSVHPHSHPERAAYLALKHSVQGIPVVDHDGKFEGAITSASLLKILDTGALEDMLRFGGVVHSGVYDTILNVTLSRSFWHRVPWLVLGLCGGILAAGFISGFEEFLGRNVILAAFIPLIVYMSDAVGTQMEAFIIRDLAVQPSLPFLRYFMRQFAVVSAIGFVVALFLYAISLVLYTNPALSLVLAVALFAGVISSVLTGLLVPYLFEKLSFDPANASGPIATIIQDLLTVYLYFEIASRILP